ncbi:MAG: endonuclease III [Akkermansiaceae bacterium]|nr:endonuclease III [Akkermansiaceae bacterium]
MTIAQRARIVSGVLDARLPEPQIPLQHRDPFTLLVSVILSAQCTDERVNKVTPALFRRASTPEAMAALSPETVREYISSCGLSERKARNIVETSRILVEQYDGCVPNRFEELEALPGVGHKTASVVMNQAFGLPAFPVDTHIFRLARRWKLSKGENVEKVEIDLKKIFPKDEWGKRHLQIVLYGRQFCPARGCGDLCPICSALFSGNR